MVSLKLLPELFHGLLTVFKKIKKFNKKVNNNNNNNCVLILWNSCPLLSELICTGCFWAALVSVFLAGCTRVSYFTLFISESVDPDFLFLISMLTSVWCDCRHSGKSRSSKVLVNFHVILACPFIVLSITSSSSIKNISGDSRLLRPLRTVLL